MCTSRSRPQHSKTTRSHPRVPVASHPCSRRTRPLGLDLPTASFWCSNSTVWPFCQRLLAHTDLSKRPTYSVEFMNLPLEPPRTLPSRCALDRTCLVLNTFRDAWINIKILIGPGHSQKVRVDLCFVLLSTCVFCAPRRRDAPLATPKRAPRPHPSRVD